MSKTSRPGSRRTRRLSLLGERVEQRLLLAPFVVQNTNNSGPGSLRQAILNVNAASGVQTIDFNIPGSGVHTISPLSALPAITVPVILDGTSQPGFAGAPIIELNGASAGTNVNGLTISGRGGGSTVRGLVINRFGGNGIQLNASGNVVAGNIVGTTSGPITDAPFKFQPLGNGGDGIVVGALSTRNIIGLPGAGNLVVANKNYGIEIRRGADFNTVS